MTGVRLLCTDTIARELSARSIPDAGRAAVFAADRPRQAPNRIAPNRIAPNRIAPNRIAPIRRRAGGRFGVGSMTGVQPIRRRRAITRRPVRPKRKRLKVAGSGTRVTITSMETLDNSCWFRSKAERAMV